MVARLKRLIAGPLILALVIIGVHLVDIVLPFNLNVFGIRPRSAVGLVGVPLSPFLHSGFNHLISNIVPLFVLGVLLCAYGRVVFRRQTGLLILVSGLLTWLFSSAGIVIGASGLVFAYWSYLVTVGVKQRTWLTILVAIISAVLYGGLLISLTSIEAGISWAGHFSGLLAGILLGLKSPRKKLSW